MIQGEEASEADVTEPEAETEAEPEAETEAVTGETRLANSWRYKDGEPIQSQERAAARTASNAWEKVDGRYVNSYGDPIPGAQLKGVDVSEWQEQIDWEKAKEDGIEYAIIRVGWHGNNDSHVDDWFEYNVSECERLGIPYGVYLYSYITTTAGAANAANFVLNQLKGHTLSYPVYLDLEDESTISTDHGAIAETFLNKITAAGYRGGVYANLNWWNNYLTSSVFDNAAWSKWVAQYNFECNYTGTYDMWQCTSKGSVDGIAGYADLNFWMVKTYDQQPVEVEDPNIISCSSHMQTFGWQPTVQNGYQTGVTGYSKRLEALKISIGDGYGDLGVKYSAHVQTYGWMDYVENGETAGTVGESKRIEAVKIELTGAEAEKYDIYYRVHSQTYGWLDWASNGQPAGTQGYGKRLEALQIAVVPKGSGAPGSTEKPFEKAPMTVTYSTYVSGSGWTTEAQDGATSGTTGKSTPLEAFQVSIDSPDYTGGVEYEAYMQGFAWNGEKADGAEAGLPGGGKRLEAVRIALNGELAEHYDIYYRAYVQTYGWLDWASNGQTAGTLDYAKRMEALEIRLVAKGAAAPGETDQPSKQAVLRYSTHVQTYGWQGNKYDGETSGTTGQAKRLEAVKIDFANGKNADSIRYKTHVQTYGWDEDWTKGGQIAGTTGQAKRMEAIQIELTGKMAEQYDIYYRVHSQTYGWLDWARNGESAGTEGLSKRLEAIEICLVKKGAAAPGSTEQPFVKA
nr:GH25 family lysozyme [Mordavella massiliensis]